MKSTEGSRSNWGFYMSSTTPSQPDELDLFMQSVLESLTDDPAESLERIEKASQEIERFATHEGYDEASRLLNAQGTFHLAILQLQAMNFSASAESFASAAKGFTELEIEDLANLCDAFRTYVVAATELQNLNLTAGLDLLKKAETGLAGIGEVGSVYRRIIEHMMPEQLFVAGVVALGKQQITSAQVLITDAAQKSESLANTYYEEESEGRSWFLGLGKLYRSRFNLFKLSFALGLFDVMEASEIDDPRPMAREARELLAKIHDPNAIQKNIYALAGGIVSILDAQWDAIRVVRATLMRQPVPDDIDYTALNKHLSQSENELAAGGEANLAIVQQCQQMTALMKNLRRLVGEKTIVPKKGRVTLFVMMPFSPASKLVEDALRAVLESDPYWFQIILARDQTICENLFDNVKAHMDVVDGFLADISDLNPNVMLELGMTESDPQKRPVFVLRRAGSNEPPTDLKGRLYIEYTLPPADANNPVQNLAEQLRQSLRAIDEVKKLLNRRRARYLSTQYIREQTVRSRLILDESEMKRLQEEFPSLEVLEASTAEYIAEKAELGIDLAEKIANIFKSKRNTTLQATG